MVEWVHRSTKREGLTRSLSATIKRSLWVIYPKVRDESGDAVRPNLVFQQSMWSLLLFFALYLSLLFSFSLFSLLYPFPFSSYLLDDGLIQDAPRNKLYFNNSRATFIPDSASTNSSNKEATSTVVRGTTYLHIHVGTSPTKINNNARAGNYILSQHKESIDHRHFAYLSLSLLSSSFLPALHTEWQLSHTTDNSVIATSRQQNTTLGFTYQHS